MEDGVKPVTNVTRLAPSSNAHCYGCELSQRLDHSMSHTQGWSSRSMSVRGMDGPGGLASSLRTETEMQKMLADEKMRSEQHMNNYQSVKAEHTRLQDKYVSLQREIQTANEKHLLAQGGSKNTLEQMRKELMAKHLVCEDLRTQVMTEQRLEALKVKLTEEVENSLRVKIAHINEENDQYRNEYNKVKYEYSFLKAEYEHEKVEHSQIVEELRIRHESEVTNLRKERDMITARSQTDPNADAHRARTMLRENAQLHLKIKGLLGELEEIRALREHQGLQSDHVTRLQSKQLIEHSTNVKSLETERESLRLQVENLSRELSIATDLHTTQTSRVHDLEKSNLVLKNQTEEVTHKAKVDLTSLKMEMLRERGELERQRDKLVNEYEELKCQLDIAQCSLDAQNDALIQKEKEGARRIQAAQELEWGKLTQLENEKMELETKLQESARRKIDEDTRRQAENEAVEERMRRVMEAKEEAEKEALVFKTKLLHHEALMSEVERERAENADLKVRLHRLDTEVQMYTNNERELLDQNQRLKSQFECTMADLKMAKDTFATSQKEADRMVSEHRVTFCEEKGIMRKRLEEQDDQLAQLHQKLAANTNLHKRKKRRYAKIVSRLKDKLSLSSAKMEELKIERDALKKYVPLDQHIKLKKQLNDLLRRHRDFRSLMTTVETGQALDISGISASIEVKSGGGVFYDGIDSNAEKELEHLRSRLDHLDDNQQQQMDELRTITKMASPTSDYDKDDGQEKCSECSQ